MIWIFNLEKASAFSCDNYDDLFQYINELEELRLSKINTQLLQPSVRRVSNSKKGSALKKQWCLEYCKDNNFTIVENCLAANNPSKNPRSSQKHSEQPLFTREAS